MPFPYVFWKIYVECSSGKSYGPKEMTLMHNWLRLALSKKSARFPSGKILNNMCWFIVFAVWGMGESGCSVMDLKKDLLKNTDTVIITFYDSEVMNKKAVESATSVEIASDEEIEAFVDFISNRPMQREFCEPTGSASFYNKGNSLQRMSFNLDQGCGYIEFDKTDSQEARRVSRRGLRYLKKQMEQAVTPNP